jgi:hypothetical protein
MSKAFKCDRCKNFYTTNVNYFEWSLPNKTHFNLKETEYWDLCDTCASVVEKQLSEWKDFQK